MRQTGKDVNSVTLEDISNKPITRVEDRLAPAMQCTIVRPFFVDTWWILLLTSSK